jgi:hypothetical protein
MIVRPSSNLVQNKHHSQGEVGKISLNGKISNNISKQSANQ